MMQRKVIRVHDTKRRWHEAKLKTLENPTIVINVGWQNLPQPWSYMLCSQYVQWCHINKKWPLSMHEVCKNNNSAQYTSCVDEHMKAIMLEVHMAMMGSHFFPKTKCL